MIRRKDAEKIHLGSGRLVPLHSEAEQLLRPLGAARQAQGQFMGLMTTLGFGDRRRAELTTRIEEAVETADIEGEAVSRAAVRSSIW